MTIALVSPRPVRGMSTQVVPPSVEYCHVPWSGVAVLPTMAMPVDGVPVDPLGTVSVPSV